MYILGNDASYWQGSYDPKKNIKAKMSFVIFRSSYGEYTNHDKKFREWSWMAHDAGYSDGVSAYHFIKPGHDFNAQMEWFQEQIEAVPMPNLSILPNTVFLDCEHNDGKSASEVSSYIAKAAEYVKKHITVGNYPGIYTGQWWWNSNVLRSSFWSKLPLWVANWNVDTPALPYDWAVWSIWQYTVLKGPGSSYGWGSQDIDMNRIAQSVAPPPTPELPEFIVSSSVVGDTTYAGKLLKL